MQIHGRWSPIAVPISVDKSIPERLDLLDSYLNRQESRFCTIRSNCEKKIAWHAGKRDKTNYSIVYIHGFSATRMETWPLCDHLAAILGANLFYTRLSGHGQDGPAMGNARVEDWLADGLEAVTIGSRIGDRVILVGMSTGGTLATWLAAQPSTAPWIHRLILLSPNFFPKNPLAAAALWPPGLRLFKMLFGGWRSFTVTNDLHARYWTARYPINAITTMMQLVRLTWQIDLKQATMPVLMMVNPWDRVINVSLAIFRFRRFPSKRKKWTYFRGNKDLGRHVLAGEILSRQTTGQALTVIRDFLGDHAA
jgi:pimeloyl-ACP methyl ester carboxylesterase